MLSPDGSSHEVLAGSGEGPGDVSYVGAVFALGQDRFLAVDIFRDRLTIFAGGSVERTVVETPSIAIIIMTPVPTIPMEANRHPSRRARDCSSALRPLMSEGSSGVFDHPQVEEPT